MIDDTPDRPIINWSILIKSSNTGWTIQTDNKLNCILRKDVLFTNSTKTRNAATMEREFCQNSESGVQINQMTNTKN